MSAGSADLGSLSGDVGDSRLCQLVVKDNTNGEVGLFVLVRETQFVQIASCIKFLRFFNLVTYIGLSKGPCYRRNTALTEGRDGDVWLSSSSATEMSQRCRLRTQDLRSAMLNLSTDRGVIAMVL